jgi:hypothetical protein
MQKGTISYAKDKNAHAIDMGFDGYMDAVVKLYFDHKLSYSQTAEKLNVTSSAIRYLIRTMLKKIPRGRGGPNNVRNKEQL